MRWYVFLYECYWNTGRNIPFTLFDSLQPSRMYILFHCFINMCYFAFRWSRSLRIAKFEFSQKKVAKFSRKSWNFGRLCFIQFILLLYKFGGMYKITVPFQYYSLSPEHTDCNLYIELIQTSYSCIWLWFLIKKHLWRASNFENVSKHFMGVS